MPALAEKLEHAQRIGTLPKVVVPVHFAGQPTEQEAIWSLAQQYGFKIIEDASHVDRRRTQRRTGRQLPLVRHHGVQLSSGEDHHHRRGRHGADERRALGATHGAAAYTRDHARRGSVYQRREVAQDGAPPAWYYEQQMLGFNYRMTDIQAVLGMSQLQRLDNYVARRNELARRYDERCADLPLQLPAHPDREPARAFHLYVVRLETGAASRRRIGRCSIDCAQRGIGVNLHYIPVHLQPYYRALGFASGPVPAGRGVLTRSHHAAAVRRVDGVAAGARRGLRCEPERL